ncbi:MAG TPA: substrate-binding domain-containing protein [Candidatus Limnocylindria bacterium]|nr:substrate-binding domain-containing protein [Candidatus Limnocylindria bacterium]
MDIRQWGRGVGILIAALFVFGACAGGSVLPTPAKTKDPLAGDYIASGANGANPQMTALIARFQQLHPGVNFKLNDIDTETSVVNVSTGDVDFGYIGRELRATEPKITLSPIGFTGSAVAVNAANPMTNLTKDQVAKMYTVQIKDWSEVSSTAGPVKAFVREAASSTRSTIEAYVFGSSVPKYPAEVQEIFESADTIKAIGAFKGSIGTVTLSAKNLKDTTMKLIGLDGVQPTLANLNNGTWKIAKPSYMTTSPDPAKVRPAIKALVDFVKSPEGQRIISGE